MKYAIVRRFKKELQRKVKAIDVLYRKMDFYNNKAPELYELIKDKITEGRSTTADAKSYSSALVKLAQLMRQADDIAIDCAHKLAPYESPKLETLEVKSRVEQKFVIVTPQPIKSAEDWNKITGSTELDPTQIKKDILTGSTHVPSIHDFVDNDDDEPTNKDRLN